MYLYKPTNVVACCNFMNLANMLEIFLFKQFTNSTVNIAE